MDVFYRHFCNKFIKIMSFAYTLGEPSSSFLLSPLFGWMGFQDSSLLLELCIGLSKRVSPFVISFDVVSITW